MYKFIARILFGVVFIVGWILSSNANETSSQKAVGIVLDDFHKAAAQANFKIYFDLLHAQAIFLGTDSSERWTKQQFAIFVEPYFTKGIGWEYIPIKRHISTTPKKDIVFFDELLESKKYGRCRGSGLLINTEQGWKILQYNLSYPIPNELSLTVSKMIKNNVTKE